ncbi:hypothetical protein HPB50_008397 [Hyalomma asiaticum]|uniref:Uncharacterized protein n=1 Tax=Hyalomma asiaticum TaxID=266040 RepID=A0ACB7TJ83_HYAAI|nr:hypothetical protein HPB50_008397 [Hyalomma asiaticum]
MPYLRVLSAEKQRINRLIRKVYKTALGLTHSTYWVSKRGERSRSIAKSPIAATITLVFRPAHTAATSQLDCTCDRIAREKRKILLVLGNASEHVALDNLSAIELFFLPPNTAALAQPLDQGIIRSVKHLYRKNLLRRMLLAMECGKAYCIDMLGAIHLLAYSWQPVESTTVQNCFTRAKFVVRENTGESEECADDCDSLLTEVLERQGSAEALHFESFRDLHSDVATSPDLTDSEIVAAVVPHEVEDDENDDDDGDDVEANPDLSPSLTAVADAVAVMRAFAEKKGLMAKALDTPEQLVRVLCVPLSRCSKGGGLQALATECSDISTDPNPVQRHVLVSVR